MDCRCLRDSPSFLTVKTLLIIPALFLYSVCVLTANELHIWYQKSLDLTNTLNENLQKLPLTEKTPRFEVLDRIANEDRKRWWLLMSARVAFVVFFVASIILSYYVPWVYDYIIVPWSAGTTLFTNLVLFPVLLWDKGQQSGFLPRVRADDVTVCSLRIVRFSFVLTQRLNPTQRAKWRKPLKILLLPGQTPN